MDMRESSPNRFCGESNHFKTARVNVAACLMSPTSAIYAASRYAMNDLPHQPTFRNG